MYLIATLELSYGGVMDFIELAPTVRRLMEQKGCMMVHAFMQDTGRLNTFIHIWELPDANCYFEAVAALKQDEQFAHIVEVLARAVVNETLVFAQDAPYAPSAPR